MFEQFFVIIFPFAIPGLSLDHYWPLLINHYIIRCEPFISHNSTTNFHSMAIQTLWNTIDAPLVSHHLHHQFTIVYIHSNLTIISSFARYSIINYHVTIISPSILPSFNHHKPSFNHHLTIISAFLTIISPFSTLIYWTMVHRLLMAITQHPRTGTRPSQNSLRADSGDGKLREAASGEVSWVEIMMVYNG